MKQAAFLLGAAGIALAAAALFPGCTRPADAKTAAEVDDFIRSLAQAARDLDMEQYASGFSDKCPVVIHCQGKTKQTDMAAYRNELIEACSQTRENRIEIRKLDVEPRGRGYLARVSAKETVITDQRAIEADTKIEFVLARKGPRFQVVSYETWITPKKVMDRTRGVFDPMRSWWGISWEDPDARPDAGYSTRPEIDLEALREQLESSDDDDW